MLFRSIHLHLNFSFGEITKTIKMIDLRWFIVKTVFFSANVILQNQSLKETTKDGLSVRDTDT